jgi:hypothetical protein
MNITLEISKFAAQVGRPSMETVFSEHGFEYRFWDVKDLENYNYTEESLYKQRRLYVKSVLGRFSDDLGYIDLLTGDVVPSKPRYANQLEGFVELVQNEFAAWLERKSNQ